MPPQPIHDMVKEQLPVISQVLLLGDKQKFLSCLLTLAVEVDPDTLVRNRKKDEKRGKEEYETRILWR